MHNVVVIGCGAIGLTTAVEIQNLLGPTVHVTIVTEQKTPNLTSDVAAGLWTPYALGTTSEENVYKWSKGTYDFLLDLWKRGEGKEAGISLQPVTELTIEEKYVFPHWLDITLGHEIISPEKLGILRKNLKENFTYGFTYIAFVWEPSKLLPYLEKGFLKNGGRIEYKKVSHFSELQQYDVIVNCTGLASTVLTGDSECHPIRGQIIRVLSPWQLNALMVDEKYVIPNRDFVILGGTVQTGNYNTGICIKDKEDIIRSCSKYIPPLEGVEIVENKVGLRPGREKIRLELDEKSGMVHNYGHGGSGITLSVGCAREAAQLTKKALEKRKLRHKL